MKLRRTATEAWGVLRTVICILAAVLIFLISFPSFAAEESGTEGDPDKEAVTASCETKSDYLEENKEEGKAGNEEESKEENVQEESAETADENEEETGAENVQIGYVTMKAVSGNTSITN